jgi:cytochrome c-type biogenesis protein CcmH/NrfG
VSELKTTTSSTWTNAQAISLAAVSLLLGVCGGWLIRSLSTSSAPAQSVSTSSQSAAPGQPLPANFGAASALPSSQDLKQAADSQAAPLLEQLKADPTNAALLAQTGNLYYDAKQYSTAIDFYERSLKTQPANTSVRTDLGTAYWYNGDADTAITQFNKALSFEPSKPDTLFNLGIVKMQGKKDAKGAIAAWQKLLDSNPGYQQKDQVLQLMAQAQAQSR